MQNIAASCFRKKRGSKLVKIPPYTLPSGAHKVLKFPMFSNDRFPDLLTGQLIIRKPINYRKIFKISFCNFNGLFFKEHYKRKLLGYCNYSCPK